MTDTCTVNETFAGYPLGDCGQPADTVLSWQCPNGHTETADVCGQHADATAVIPTWCPSCTEDRLGRVPMSLTSEQVRA